MEKIIIQEPELISQEIVVPITIETLREQTTRHKDETIQGVLGRTNYASLMQEFIRNDSCESIQIRMSSEVAQDLNEFTYKDIDCAVKNDKYDSFIWKRNGYPVLCYAKKHKVLKPAVRPNGLFLGVSVVWLFTFICTMFCTAVSSILVVAAANFESMILNIVAGLAAFVTLCIGSLTCLGIPFCCIVMIDLELFDGVDQQKLESYPLLEYQDDL